MKWVIAVAAVALLAVGTVRADAAEDDELELEDSSSARLGFISVDANGGTTLTFNATSIQNAVILGLFILVLGGLLLPLFGIFGDDDTSGYGQYEQTGYSTGGGYEASNSGYSTYAKRSVQMMGPVMDALAAAHRKYEEEE